MSSTFHSLRAFSTTSTQARVDAAAAALARVPSHPPTTIIAATRGAADDFARRLAIARPATFGVARFSLLQFAAKTAAMTLAERGTVPSTALVSEAIATRAVFTAAQTSTLHYFDAVEDTPGFPRALVRTVGELRGAGVSSATVGLAPRVGPDLAALLERFEGALDEARVVDRARLFGVAADRLRATRLPGLCVLLDLAIDDAAERHMLEAVLDATEHVVATVLPGDAVEELLRSRNAAIERLPDEGDNDLAQLRRYLFVGDERPPQRALDGTLQLFSAPGEGRECVEIARRILDEARRGVRFDEMAVLVRSPQTYFSLIEHAMDRAGIPVWFDRGTRRPHPAGRAFLALLACALEGLSAARFAEYLSLAQVPTTETSPSPGMTDEEIGWQTSDRPVDELDAERAVAVDEPADMDMPVVVGTLRAPWRWESLIVDAQIVVGGADRWRRRLDGHRRELERRLVDAGKDEGAAGEGPVSLRLQATIAQLDHLRSFALPVVETLEQWHDAVTWGEWLRRFATFVPRVLRHPASVARALGELQPMASVGPVGLEEVRRVLADRLSTLTAEPPSRRYGRVFVGTPQQVRGRPFNVVFVPGLAERLFPQKPREDPLLLDELRQAVAPALVTEGDRVAAERLLLRLAVNAASERLYVSYPRIEVGEGRARVPSFYALDLLRAATGNIPAHEQLEEQARLAGGAVLSWPAPADPITAIDDVEHDLAVVRRLLDAPDPVAVRGHAHYLLNMSEPLRRSVVERWRRGRDDWSAVDGITRVTPSTEGALTAQRLTARAYSLSALQHFAACPYRFVLASMLRLQPLEEPAPLERMDPRTRGSLLHEIMAALLRQLRHERALPITKDTWPAAADRLDRIIEEVAGRAHEDLAPAVERIWGDDVASLRRDLHGWLGRLVEAGEWVPAYFEYAFGRVPGERDDASSIEPVVLPPGYTLRGAIDLIEMHAGTGELRVTDYKTGRVPDRLDGMVIDGGRVLQPLLYAMAAAQALDRPVVEGRLWYCTVAGNFRTHAVPVDDRTRRTAMEVLEVVDRAVAAGRLMAAPSEGACASCQFQVVCGRDVPRRVARKNPAPLADVHELRSRR